MLNKTGETLQQINPFKQSNSVIWT
jgi:hypothetical protein